MSSKLNRHAYEKMIAEDIAWLEKQPRTLERDHIVEVLRCSPDREYNRPEACSHGVRWPHNCNDCEDELRARLEAPRPEEKAIEPSEKMKAMIVLLNAIVNSDVKQSRAANADMLANDIFHLTVDLKLAQRSPQKTT